MNIKKCDVCIGNLEHGTDQVVDELSNLHPSTQIAQWGCLGNCSNCFRRPFVLINDDHILEAESAEQLKQVVFQYVNA